MHPHGQASEVVSLGLASLQAAQRLRRALPFLERPNKGHDVVHIVRAEPGDGFHFPGSLINGLLDLIVGHVLNFLGPEMTDLNLQDFRHSGIPLAFGAVADFALLQVHGLPGFRVGAP